MPTTSSKLTEWVARTASGDRAAFSKLYDATSAKLFGVILRILKDRARSEDLLQDVYLKIWQRADTFDRDIASPITWMATIARNAAIDVVRKHARDLQASDADVTEVPDTVPRADLVIEEKETWQKLEYCLGALEDEHREAVKLAYLNGHSRDEISAQLRIPVGTVKTWLHRSLKKLKECLVG